MMVFEKLDPEDIWFQNNNNLKDKSVNKTAPAAFNIWHYPTGLDDWMTAPAPFF